ncbi:MAG: DUF433 domain-containing protein [Chloroflexaceae bacterium]|nr:DUF433 domain-containing protein [Chloroflexaceae bacterium]
MSFLQDYFDFLAPDDIRIKGTRIGIESILYHYIHRGESPEEIATRFHTVSLEQVYATILYYFRNRQQVDDYLADWLEFARQSREAQRQNPPPVVQRLRQLKAAQQSSASEALPDALPAG